MIPLYLWPVVLQESFAGNIFSHPDSKPGGSQGSAGSLCEFQVLVTPPRTWSYGSSVIAREEAEGDMLRMGLMGWSQEVV